jgi:hypothetical protein
MLMMMAALKMRRQGMMQGSESCAVPEPSPAALLPLCAAAVAAQAGCWVAGSHVRLQYCCTAAWQCSTFVS